MSLNLSFQLALPKTENTSKCMLSSVSQEIFYAGFVSLVLLFGSPPVFFLSFLCLEMHICIETNARCWNKEELVDSVQFLRYLLK